MNLLEKYREQIDTIDEEIIYLLSRRFEIVKQIGIYKKENGITPFQFDRWKKVLDNLMQEAEDKGIDKDLVKNIWNLIHEESLKIEEKDKKRD